MYSNAMKCLLVLSLSLYTLKPDCGYENVGLATSQKASRNVHMNINLNVKFDMNKSSDATANANTYVNICISKNIKCFP